MAETSPLTLNAEASNCVRLELAVVLGTRVGAQAALALATMRQELESCGEIARIEHLGSDGAAMRITYWDRRSAAHVMKVYGSACSYETQDGSYTVTLTRDSLARFQDCQVAKVSELGEDLLEVDFFDCRVASNAMVLSANCSTCASLAKIGSRCDLASCETSSDTDPESVPENSSSPMRSSPRAYAAEESQASSEPHSASDAPSFKPKFLRAEHGLSLTQLSWGALEKSTEWRTELRLRGLPPCMCSRPALEEALKSLGLLDAVESVQVPTVVKAKASGWALLRAKSVEEVPRIAKAFHGRVFRGSRMPIAVSFADGGLFASAASRQKPASLSGRWGLSLPEPQRVECSAYLAQEQDLCFPPGLPIPVR